MSENVTVSVGENSPPDTSAVDASTASAAAATAQVSAAVANANAAEAENAAEGAVAAATVAASLAAGAAAQTLQDAFTRISAAELRSDDAWTKATSLEATMISLRAELEAMMARVGPLLIPSPSVEVVAENPDEGAAQEEPARRVLTRRAL